MTRTSISRRALWALLFTVVTALLFAVVLFAPVVPLVVYPIGVVTAFIALVLTFGGTS